MNNQRLELRLLAHSIDAATLSAGRSRKRKNRVTLGEKLALAAIAILAITFFVGAMQ